MSSPIILRGMAWDHPRAVNPLEAISSAWSDQKRSEGIDASITWDARPLKDFEDQPLEELATVYDLVLIDYPFVGFAANSELIVPVNEWVDSDYLADQKNHTVGPSYKSYTWNDRQWALAIDAACQVSAVRADLLSASVGQAPETWHEVAKMSTATAASSSRVAMPLNPNHAYCAFLSVGIGISGNRFWPVGGHVDAEAALDSLNFLQALSGMIHPCSRTEDPIAISDRMTASDEIIYVPLMFGYSSYARQGFRSKVLSFGDAPRGSGNHIGSVLGGVGIALSSLGANTESAAELARAVGSPQNQAGVYTTSGGQPGHSAAWESPEANSQVGNFFTSTRTTMEHAFLRPRVPGHRRFQKLAGELIHGFIWDRAISADECMTRYRELVDELLPQWQ